MPPAASAPCRPHTGCGVPGAACRVQGTGCRVWGAAWAVLCDVGALLHGAGCAWCRVPALSAHGPGLLCWGQVWGPWGRVMGGSSRGSCSVPPSGNPWRGMPWLGHGCVLLPLFCCRGDEAVFLSQGWRWVMGGGVTVRNPPPPCTQIPPEHPALLLGLGSVQPAPCSGSSPSCSLWWGHGAGLGGHPGPSGAPRGLCPTGCAPRPHEVPAPGSRGGRRG